jgi:hypothetical protein
MKAVFSIVIVCFLSLAAVGQGTILFDTHVPGLVDSRWETPNGQPFGPEWGAQLVIPTAPNEFLRLEPSTTFKSGPASELGYVNPVTVTAPDFPPGTSVTVGMNVFLLDNHSLQGLYLTQITLGGGDQPPAYLTGLPAVMEFVPEPSSWALLGVGALGLAIRWRRQSSPS